MTAPAPLPCLVCGGSQRIVLPDPGPRSMTSDWRVVEERLARTLCASCGLVRRDPTARTGAPFYAADYALYAVIMSVAENGARSRIRRLMYVQRQQDPGFDQVEKRDRKPENRESGPVRTH